MARTKIVLLGPPGSGKGTRARIVGNIYCIPVITTGDILREAVVKGTESGMTAKEYMNRGELVPDHIVISLMEKRLRQPDVLDGFVLDGFPRNSRQADALDRVLEDAGETLCFVLNVVADAETIISRLSLRRSCPNCGAVYHLRDNIPKKDEICDECGSELIQRSDDREEVIRHRFEVYEKETRPLLERYRKTGIVRDIRGDLEIEDIPEAVRRAIEAAES